MRASRNFDHLPESVPASRRFAVQTLRGLPADTVEAVELMVSELATNCIRHTEGGFELAVIQSAHELRVEATDRGVEEPQPRMPDPSDPSGRGLQIIDMLSDAWGYEPRSPAGKTVWFTLALGARSALGRACA